MLVSLAKLLFYLDVWILNPKGGQKYCSKPIYNYTSAINNMCQESCKVDWILEEPCTAYVMLSLGAQAKLASAHISIEVIFRGTQISSCENEYIYSPIYAHTVISVAWNMLCSADKSFS